MLCPSDPLYIINLLHPKCITVVGKICLTVPKICMLGSCSVGSAMMGQGWNAAKFIY